MSNFNSDKKTFDFVPFWCPFNQVNDKYFLFFLWANAKNPKLSTCRKKQLFRIVSWNNRLDSTWNQLSQFFMASSASFRLTLVSFAYVLARPGCERCVQARKHEEGAGRVKKLNVLAGDKPENCLLHQFREFLVFCVTVLLLVSNVIFAGFCRNFFLEKLAQLLPSWSK